MISARMIVSAPFYGIGAFFVWYTVQTAGPDIEIRSFPVLTDQVVGKQWQTPDHLICFKWTYTKARTVELVRQRFIVEREDGIRFPAEEVRGDLGISSNQSTTAPKGMRRTIDECVRLPAALWNVSRLTIKGLKIYKPWHRLYEIEQPLIPVEVVNPPLETFHIDSTPLSDASPSTVPHED